MRHNGGKHEDATRRPDEILAEIEHTRGEMDSTLSAIEQRLTPGQLMDQGLDYLKNSGANEFVHNLGGQVKTNPLPVALVGIGLAWLMAGGRGQPSYGSYQSSSPGMGERAGEMKDQMKDKLSGTAQSMREGASSAMSSARSTLDSARNTASQAGSRMSELGHSARDRISSLGDSARNRMERARGGMDYMMREQPLALGAIGLAIGACMAAMAPRTRQEDELMGDARDQFLDKAKEVGQEKLEDAKQVANAAMGMATKEAEKRGMTPSSSGSQGDGSARSFDGSGTHAKPPQPQTFTPPAPAGTPSIKPKAPSATETGTGTGKTGGTRNIP
jgi:ElaB/YqjD/DUF883 family membrane-anchored ribosome-binding protein